MKKIGLFAVLILIVIAGLGGGYVYLGNSIEKEYFRFLAEDGQWGPFKLTNKTYEHGVLSSKVQTELEIGNTADLAESGTTGNAQNVKIVFEHTIWHGPLALTAPGGQGMVPVPALAVIETRVAGCTPMPDDLKGLVAELPELAASRLLVTVGMDGASKSDLKIPAFAKDKDGAKVNWGGLFLSMTMSRDRSRIAGNLDMPRLDSQFPTGNFTLGAVKGSFDLSEALPLLYLGSSKLTLDALDAQYADMAGTAQKVGMKGLEVSLASSKNGTAVQMGESLKLANLTVGGATYGPGEVVLEFKNLDAQALSDFQVQLRKVYAEVGSDPQQLSAKTEHILAMYKDLLNKCLKGSPEMSVSKLHLSTSRGDADGHFLLKVVATPTASLDNPLALLQNVESTADVTVQEKLLKALLLDEMKREMAAEGADAQQNFSEAELAKLVEEQYSAQIGPLVQQKYIVREGETLKSSATFKSGKLNVNGQTIPLF